jgi:hypothetical protein
MFKVGDKVKYVSGEYGDEIANPLWGGINGKIEGVVVKKEIFDLDSLPIQVHWSNGFDNDYRPIDLEHIKKNSNIEFIPNKGGV